MAVVGVRFAADLALTIVVIIAVHIGGVGAIVGGKSELLGFREAASVGGLFLDADLLLGTIGDLKSHNHQLKPRYALIG